MASRKFRDLGKFASVAFLLPAFLTLNVALNAQNPSDASRVRQALGFANGNDTNSTANFKKIVAGQMEAASAAALATTASAILPKFIAHRDYAAADAPVNFATGDLNGDGIADLVVPNFNNSTSVSVLLGKRDGSFQPLRLFDSGGSNPFDAVVADFNGDGNNDVAVTFPFGGVSILRGDGQGHIGTPELLSVGAHPLHVVAADFNGDHKMDLAVTNLESNNVSILLGRGDGTFTVGPSSAVGMGPAGIVLGDFNRDGKVDLAVANSGVLSGGNQGAHANTVAILLGTGTGHFQAPVFLPVAKTPLLLAVADFNKDSKQDLVVSNNGGSVVSELLGNGNGTFQTPRTFHVQQALSIGVADFNTDGNPDLVVSNGNGQTSTSSTVALLLGDGTGNFNPAKQIPAGRQPSAVLAGDFNHDGKADYITSNLDANTVSVVLGKGNGTFNDIGPDVPSNGDGFSAQIIAGDFNNDGITDLAQVNTGLSAQVGNSVSVLLGKSGGGFQAGKVTAVGRTNPSALAAGDVNNDGHLDLAVTTAGNAQEFPRLAILLGNGDGTFGAPHLFIPGSGNPISIALADVNGDGRLDAVIAEDPPLVIGSGGVFVLLGDGQGGFGSPKLIATIGLGQVRTVTAADFNRDGKMDIAYLSVTDQNRVTVLLGNGNGTFQAPKVVTSAGLGTLFSTYSIGDFNNDGILDFSVEEFTVIEVLLGNGDGTFNSKGSFFEGTVNSFPFVPSLVLADFNGDGFLDVAAPDGFAESVSLLLGKGDGTLRSGQLFAGGLADSAVAVRVAGFQPGIAMTTQGSKVRVVRNATAAK